MVHKTSIIYLTGQPGMGKYTIAKALAAEHKFVVCDNQLINNPILESSQYGGYSSILDFAWHAIGGIRRCVFAFLKQEQDKSYILTNCLYEDAWDQVCYAEVVYMAEKRGPFLCLPVF